MKLLTTAFAALAIAAAGLAPTQTRAETPTVKIAVLKFGTVNWLMETIKQNGFDTENGIALETVPLAGGAATSVAFQAGEVDMIVKDWVWAFYQRDRGVEIEFAPFSNTLGALMAQPGIEGLCDLRGKTLGVVGGELDKSWIVLQALATRDCGFDLAAETEVLFGAPPLMSKQLQDGTVDAVSTYWHFAAKLEAAGMTRLQGVTEAMAELGIDPAPPLIGFVWDTARTDPAHVAAFLRAAEQARELLAESDAEWEARRPMMRAANDAEFLALRDAYRAGRPGPWTEANTAAAGKLYDLLTTLGGAEFQADAGPFAPEVFKDPAATDYAG